MNLFDLQGKVAIVTGGNSGIGLGMARGLADAGATVVIAARNQDKSEGVVQALLATGAEASAVRTDVTSEADISAMVSHAKSQHGRVDILVNNAGINIRKRPEDMTADEWRAVLDTNVTSAFLASKAVYHEMKANGGGKILNNGSMASIFGLPFAPAYGASKGGIVQLTKSLAVAWAPDNIQVNAFLPGWIDTPLTQNARTEVSGLHERILDRTPAGRWGDIDDFAGVAVFLASTASDFVTGVALPIDGGYSTAGG
ncbi:MAG: glucose 1-dehydrogenase [Gammaproteobacteria bacterium]|nr:glucose 1-dehydrogenase [Gammaproteobacteria bacterium]